MNKYKLIYECDNGYKGEEIVYAANRTMAFEMFKEFGIENVVNVDCVRVIEQEVIIKRIEV